MLWPAAVLLLPILFTARYKRQPNWEQSLKQIFNAFDGAAAWKLTGALLLMILNWGLEARKWQLVINPPSTNFFTAMLKGGIYRYYARILHT
jgi:hypothetical protein